MSEQIPSEAKALLRKLVMGDIEDAEVKTDLDEISEKTLDLAYFIALKLSGMGALTTEAVKDISDRVQAFYSGIAYAFRRASMSRERAAQGRTKRREKWPLEIKLKKMGGKYEVRLEWRNAEKLVLDDGSTEEYVSIVAEGVTNRLRDTPGAIEVIKETFDLDIPPGALEGMRELDIDDATFRIYAHDKKLECAFLTSSIYGIGNLLLYTMYSIGKQYGCIPSDAKPSQTLKYLCFRVNKDINVSIGDFFTLFSQVLASGEKQEMEVQISGADDDVNDASVGSWEHDANAPAICVLFDFSRGGICKYDVTIKWKTKGTGVDTQDRIVQDEIINRAGSCLMIGEEVIQAFDMQLPVKYRPVTPRSIFLKPRTDTLALKFSLDDVRGAGGAVVLAAMMIGKYLKIPGMQTDVTLTNLPIRLSAAEELDVKVMDILDPAEGCADSLHVMTSKPGDIVH